MSIFTGLVHRSASSVPTAAAATMRTKMRMIMNNNPSSSHFSSVVTSSNNNKLMPTRIRQLLQSQQQSLTNKIKRFSTTIATKPVGGGRVTGSSTSSSSSSSSASSSSSSSTTSKSGSSGSFSFLKWYEKHLSKSPITTKMISGAFLWGIGDMVAQIIPQIIVKNDDGESQLLSSSSSSSSSTSTTSASINSTYISTTTAYPSMDDIVSNLDWIRTGKAVLFGFAIHAPASHGHFNLLEYMTNKLKLNGLSIPIFKTIMEQFIYWSWISNSMYHSYMGIMDGLSPSQIYNKLEAVLWDTQKAQWMFWIPIQLLNFQFIPIRHQLNVVLVTSIVWTALLSMWYPPPSVPAPITTTTTKEEESEKSTTTTE